MLVSGDTNLKVLNVGQCFKKFFSIHMTRRKIVVDFSGMTRNFYRYFQEFMSNGWLLLQTVH